MRKDVSGLLLKKLQLTQNQMMNNPSLVNPVKELYLKYLGREADHAGLFDYVTSGMAIADVERSIRASHEAKIYALRNFKTSPDKNIIDVTEGNKYAIYQYYVPNKVDIHELYLNERLPEWVHTSINHFRKYAKEVGADYYFYTDTYCKEFEQFDGLYFFEATRVYKDPQFDKYDKVLYVDVDVIPKRPVNIFDIDVVDVAGAPERCFEEHILEITWCFEPAATTIPQIRNQLGVPYAKAKTVDLPRNINSGVLLWSKQGRLKARDLFDSPIDHVNKIMSTGISLVDVDIADQGFYNTMFEKYNIDVLELGMEWNRFPTKNDSFPCNFAHYVGRFKNFIPQLYPLNVDVDREEIFTDIFKTQHWGKGIESVSGPGSDLHTTQNLRNELPLLIEKFNIKTILDAPCGDMNWMKHVLNNVKLKQYIGADIVKPLIEQNILNYKSDNVDFMVLDIVEDKLPKSDLMICRDCLFHLSETEIKKFFKNFIKSNIKYLLTTSMPANNRNIVTGMYRELNLLDKPYIFNKNYVYEIHDYAQGQALRMMYMWSRDSIIEVIKSWDE